MPSTHPSVEPEPTVPRLLVVMTVALIAIVAVEGALIAFGGWWLLGVTMIALIGATAGVVAAINHVLSEGPRVAPRVAAVEPEPEAVPEPAARPVTAPAGSLALGH